MSAAGPVRDGTTRDATAPVADRPRVDPVLVEIVAGSGHYVDMEKPDELAKLVAAFINSN